MTKASLTRKQKKLGIIAPVTRNLTPSECLELQEMQRLVTARKFEAAQIGGNTALVPDGQKVAEQIKAIAALLENAKNLWVAQKLRECGYSDGTKCSLNLTTGEITPETA
jgi:hypothetical protein